MQKVTTVIFKLLLVTLYFVSLGVHANDLDIRASSSLLAGQGNASYTASIGQCDQVASIKAGSSGELQLFTNNDVRRPLDQPTTCLVDFAIEGASRFNPEVEIETISGNVLTHSENFSIENLAPSLTLDSVNISSESSGQSLIVKLSVVDDTDVSYVGFNIMGVRASDIRTAGGVIADAKDQAYARTNGVERVYPRRESQSVFSLDVPIEHELSMEAIASDSVVLIDAYAVDSSGNQRAISEIALTGGQIKEDALSLSVANSHIVINNTLQTPTLKPSVEFEFRGLVDMSGAGRGVTYESSHPDVIAVTNEGVIYPLKESGSADVAVTIAYKDLPPVSVPVEVDFSKNLIGLEVDSDDPGNHVVLDGLNRFHELPEVKAVFDDGSNAQLSSNWSVKVDIPEVYAGLLQQNSAGHLKASAVIPESNLC